MNEESVNEGNVKSLIKDKIRKCIAVNVYNAIYVDKVKCDSQVEFSDIVKKATKRVVPVEFTDGVMKMTLEEFERESIAFGDVTAEQLIKAKSGNFKFVLRCDYTDPNLTAIELMRVPPSKERFTRLTDQFKYGCDDGSLGIVVNGMDFMVSNCVGDGEGTVYITDKSHFDLDSPFDDESVLTFGSYDKEAEYITVGLRRFDICECLEPVMIMKGRHFSISRIRNSHDFIIRVTDLKFTRKPKSNQVGTILDDDEYIDICDDEEKSQIESKLESFLLESADLKEWPTRGTPIHWHIVVKDENWFNEFAHLHQNEDPNKGDFTEIHYVPGFLIKLAGWRGNVMFTVPLYPTEEKPMYTLKEGIEKISEFIIAGKIEIPGFEYN